MRRHALAPVFLALLAAGCDNGDPSAPPDIPAPNPDLGFVAFQRECAICHASADGFDLAFFSFTDTTIIRRAVAHVDTATARNIVAHVRTLRTPRMPEELRLFQAGTPLATDLDFAVALFGRDAWPADLTTAALLAIDPRQMRIAVQLPMWSDELSNLDWMPDTPLPSAILDFNGGLVAGTVAGYRAVPTTENLRRALMALRTAERTPANAGAPCLLEDPLRVNFRECFEVRRWASTLVAQHMLRFGVTQPLGPDLHDVWWDVGNAARRSRADASRPIANPVENWVTWMFLGWAFDPSRFPSVYTGGGFRQLGLVRHATFVAARSQVARPRNSPAVYADLLQVVRFSPNPWTTTATSFALRHLLERLNAGDRPQRPEQITEAIAQVNMAITEAGRKVSAADRDALAALGQQVIARLEPQ